MMILVMPFLIFASNSIDEEIINDLDFYQNLELVQESKNVLDINLDSVGLAASEEQVLSKSVLEKGN